MQTVGFVSISGLSIVSEVCHKGLAFQRTGGDTLLLDDCSFPGASARRAQIQEKFVKNTPFICLSK